LISVATVVPLVVFIPKTLRTKDELKRIAGTDVLGTRDAGWKLGGIFYYAPDDPAVFVPKRLGIGQTVNFARPMAWLFLTVVLVLPLAGTVVAIALAK
jgi:uncharacterized membrane protein